VTNRAAQVSPIGPIPSALCSSLLPETSLREGPLRPLPQVHTAVNSAFLPFASIEAKASLQALGTTPYGASTMNSYGGTKTCRRV